MREFVIKVNGKEYQVEVEELRNGAPVASTPAPVSAPKAVPAAAPAPKAVPKAAPAATGGSAGAVKVNAPMPGTILDIKVNPGDTVAEGQVLCILEAMKMENEIVAPQAGKVATVATSKGASVNSGDVLVTLN